MNQYSRRIYNIYQAPPESYVGGFLTPIAKEIREALFVWLHYEVFVQVLSKVNEELNESVY